MSREESRIRHGDVPPALVRSWPVISRVYGRVIRWAAALAAITSLLLGTIGFIAFRETGLVITAVIPAAFFLMACGWFWVLWVTPRRVFLNADHVEIIWLARRITLRYDEILAIESSPRAIELRLLGRTRVVRRLAGNDDAWLLKQLRRRAPVAQEAFRRQMAAGLPLTIHARRAVPTVFFMMGLALLAIAIGLVRYAVTQATRLTPVDWAVAVFMIIVLVVIGALFTYQYVWSNVWRYTFTPEKIVLAGLIRKRQIPAENIKAVAHEGFPRLVRGIPRTLHRIIITFTDKPPLVLTPNGENFPLDYVDELERERLSELASRLHHHYVSRQQPDGEGQPVEESVAPKSGQAWQSLLRRIAANRADFGVAFETYRDEILAFGPGIMPDVLELARRGDMPWAIELWAMVLADAAYPPAMASFVEWLENDNDQLRFIAAMALDELADGRFQIEGLIDGGWVNHEEVKAIVPSIRAWWFLEGQSAVPDLASWAAARQTSTTVTARQKRFEFIERNPSWVMLGNGIVEQPKPGSHLPRGCGIHVIGGDILFVDEAIPRPAAVEMDSDAGVVSGVFVKEGGRWIEATSFSAWVQPYFTFKKTND